jgi:beta-phosphoglucomutase-like phosphatase (HAD superfamily)
VIRAAIFDLDGLLIDSEPLWQDAELELFPTVGHELLRPDCARTRGLRIDEAVRYWFAIRPWTTPTCDELASAIAARVKGLMLERGQALPGALEAIELSRRLGLKVAVASSSSDELIAAALQRLGIAGLDAVRSAQHETYGKPHPAVLLSTARDLGVDPTQCVVLEDSLHGVVAARAARMRCVAVPEAAEAGDARFGIADVRLRSLAELDATVLLG